MKIKFLNLSKFIIKLNTQLLSFYKIYFKLKNPNPNPLPIQNFIKSGEKDRQSLID